jgi:hypothetical protein
MANEASQHVTVDTAVMRRGVACKIWIQCHDVSSVWSVN